MTELEATNEMTRSDVAEFLREFAVQLDTAGPTTDAPAEADSNRVTFMVGSESATIDPPEMVRFEVEVDADGSLVGDDVEHEVEFELAWTTDGTEADEPQVEPEIK